MRTKESSKIYAFNLHREKREKEICLACDNPVCYLVRKNGTIKKSVFCIKHVKHGYLTYREAKLAIKLPPAKIIFPKQTPVQRQKIEMQLAQEILSNKDLSPLVLARKLNRKYEIKLRTHE